MASTNLSEKSRLGDIRERTPEYRLFAALRLLETHYSSEPRFGEANLPSDSSVVLSQKPYLSFPNRDLDPIATATAGDDANLDAEKLELVNLGFGLFGPNGPLPFHLTEYADERERHHNDPTFAAFLNIFHDRLIALFYRAWADGQPCVALERPESNVFDLYIGAIAGLYREANPNKTFSPHLAGDHHAMEHCSLHCALGHAGLFADSVRTAEGLETLLASIFDLPIMVREFADAWLPLEEDDQMCLGGQSLLGENTNLGAQIFSIQHKFTVICGPVDLDDFNKLLPGGSLLKNFCHWVTQYVGEELEWDLELVLAQNSLPQSQLGEFGQLGWSACLGDVQDFDPTNTGLKINIEPQAN